MQSAKLAYSLYEAELAAKQRLLEQTSKVEKQKEIEDTKHRETKEEINTIIASLQQVRIDKILLNSYFFFSFILYWYTSNRLCLKLKSWIVCSDKLSL